MFNLVYFKMLIIFDTFCLSTQFGQWWNINTGDQTFRGQMCLDPEAFKYCPYLFLLLSRFIEIVSRVQSET